MSRLLDDTYSEKGAVFGLIDRTLILAVLILPSCQYKLDLKDDLQGGSVSNLRLKRTFEEGNFAIGPRKQI